MFDRLDVVVVADGIMREYGFDAIMIETDGRKTLCVSDDADLSDNIWHTLEG